MAWQRPEFCPLDQSQLSLNTELPLHLFPFRVLKLSTDESTRARARHHVELESRGTQPKENREGELCGELPPRTSTSRRLIRVSGTSWTHQPHVAAQSRLHEQGTRCWNFLERFSGRNGWMESEMKFVRKISFWFSTLQSTEIEVLFKSDAERFRRDL